MAESFDPYLRWLGIRDPRRPPNHYRLLGLDLFENDSDVIAVAADRQMAHLRTFQTGQFAGLSQRLLNELAAARICLLKPDKKAAYDALLKKQLGAPVAARPTPQTAVASAAAEVDSRQTAAEEFLDFASHASATAPTKRAASSSTNPSNRSTAKKTAASARKRKSIVPWIGLAAAGVLLVVGVIVMQSSSDPAHLANSDGSNNPAPAATGTKTPSNVVQPKSHAAEKPASHQKQESQEPTAHDTTNLPPPAPKRSQPLESATPTGDTNSAPNPSSGPAPPARPNGSPPEPPLHPARDVALVDNPPQHDLPDKSPSPEKPTSPKIVPSKPLAETPSKPDLSPVPDRESLAAAEKTIVSIYKTEIEQANHGGPDAKTALAKQLIARGVESSDNPAARYALFAKARDLAVAGGDVAVASEAVKKLVGLYAIDRAEDQLLTCFAALAKTVRSRDAADSLRTAAERAADGAFTNDKYELAGKYARLATGVAKQLRDQVAGLELKSKLAEVERCKKEFNKLTDTLAKLRTEPNDADANLAAGRFYAFTKGDFDKALPYLAKASDAALKDAAKKDLSAPTDASEQAKLGDAWWSIAEANHDPAKSHVQAHAAIWYSKASPKLKGLAKGEVESRLKEIEAAAQKHTLASRTLLTKILTQGVWRIHFNPDPKSNHHPEMDGFDYPKYRFFEDGTAKGNTLEGIGHWTLEGNVVTVKYEAPRYLYVREKYEIVGDTLLAEQLTINQPQYSNRGIGTKIP